MEGGLRGPPLSIFAIAQEPWKLGPSNFSTFPKTKLSKFWNNNFIGFLCFTPPTGPLKRCAQKNFNKIGHFLVQVPNRLLQKWEQQEDCTHVQTFCKGSVCSLIYLLCFSHSLYRGHWNNSINKFILINMTYRRAFTCTSSFFAMRSLLVTVGSRISSSSSWRLQDFSCNIGVFIYWWDGLNKSHYTEVIFTLPMPPRVLRIIGS